MSTVLRHSASTIVTAAWLAAAVGCLMALRPAQADPPQASTPAAVPSAEVDLASCREQPPQPFLIRSSYIPRGGSNAAESRRRRAAHEAAVRYRTEHYGYFEGFGTAAMNPNPPRFYAVTTRFMGHSVRMHRRVVPALRCVEAALRRSCRAQPYRPHALAGIRFQNTYHTGEITNHAYGIAIDIDPTDNTCCHCVGRWAQHPLCLRPARSIYDRMVMPECWVGVFERYGFYWLGHDALQDTMHFEFLGDPDRILR